MLILALVLAALSCTLSAAAGMGGSLILVPAFAMLLGAKQGIALAALVLAANNIAKVVAYRKTIPIRTSLVVLGLTMVGAALGSVLLVHAPESLVGLGVIAAVGLCFLFEHRKLELVRRPIGGLYAFCAGATSGFSGTSGPLKGASLRSLKLDHLHLVGAASVVSLGGDLMKTVVFVKASLIEEQALSILYFTIPIMPLATFLGRSINRGLGEKYYSILFWFVMIGYTARLFFDQVL